MDYKISVKAFEDMESIWLYTFENWSIEQADRYLNLIFDEIEYLAENPTSGKDYNHIRKGYGCARVKLHLIFYRINNAEDILVNNDEDILEVIRILHERMDIENRLRD